MMAFAVVVGAALVSLYSLASLWQNLVYGFITGFALTAASMTINDYFDREIDAVNEPARPIPSGLIRPKEALIFAFFLTAVGFASAFGNSYLTNLSNGFSLLIAIIAWLIFVTYTTVGKRSGFPGNLLVSACVAIPFIYGSVAVINEVGLNVVIFAFMAFLSNTGREITKGVVDVQGDKTQNVRTVAVHFGEKTAAISAVIFYLSAVLLSPTPRFLNIVSFWFVPIVVAADSGFVICSLMLLRDYSRENARKVKNYILFVFFIGLLAFIIGAIK
jgi:geranylgeranylglycerol-phosphate geranylgeranyltransferase